MPWYITDDNKKHFFEEGAAIDKAIKNGEVKFKEVGGFNKPKWKHEIVVDTNEKVLEIINTISKDRISKVVSIMPVNATKSHAHIVWAEKTY